jgi:hypothetical protein
METETWVTRCLGGNRYFVSYHGHLLKRLTFKYIPTKAKIKIDYSKPKIKIKTSPSGSDQRYLSPSHADAQIWVPLNQTQPPNKLLVVSPCCTCHQQAAVSSRTVSRPAAVNLDPLSCRIHPASTSRYSVFCYRLRQNRLLRPCIPLESSCWSFPFHFLESRPPDPGHCSPSASDVCDVIFII